jgi:hypothetical protein
MLAVAGLGLRCFAGLQPIEVEADIFPSGAFGRDPHDAMLMVRCVLAEMKPGHATFLSPSTVAGEAGSTIRFN